MRLGSDCPVIPEAPIVRPYRHGLTAVQALGELRRHVGTQFDAELVDALQDLYEQGRLGLEAFEEAAVVEHVR
jgi:HD-GYP domain-containing protein (c-di-GMP phosphodiesterase class II)